MFAIGAIEEISNGKDPAKGPVFAATGRLQGDIAA
jgi:hypothetical protein